MWPQCGKSSTANQHMRGYWRSRSVTWSPSRGCALSSTTPAHCHTRSSHRRAGTTVQPTGALREGKSCLLDGGVPCAIASGLPQHNVFKCRCGQHVTSPCCLKNFLRRCSFRNHSGALLCTWRVLVQRSMTDVMQQCLCWIQCTCLSWKPEKPC